MFRFDPSKSQLDLADDPSRFRTFISQLLDTAPIGISLVLLHRCRRSGFHSCPRRILGKLEIANRVTSQQWILLKNRNFGMLFCMSARGFATMAGIDESTGF